MTEPRVWSVPAIEVIQGPSRRLYGFAFDGKQVPLIATVSRIRRDTGTVQGYQRPEILSHISEIREYVESDSPMIPNSIVLAFDSRVVFLPDDGRGPSFSRSGRLQIPVDPDLAEENKPGFVVDGQQRLAAIRDAKVDGFPIMITAFITEDVQEQTEQFMLVNSTRPLPKSLIYELLPYTGTRLPKLLERRKFPAYLLDRLNSEPYSPFRGKIRTPTNPAGIVKDNSILRMLENSLSDGALYCRRHFDDEHSAADIMLDVLNAFWGATAEVFHEAWGLPPRKSRLMHGAGIVSMGFVMDAIADRRSRESVLSLDHFERDLQPLKDVCKWTHGYWDFGPGNQRKWDELQNTSKDINLLSNYLLVKYKEKVWSKPEWS